MANITFLFFLSPVGPVSLRLVMGASRELRRYGNFSVVGRAIMTGLRGVRGLGTFSGEGGATAEGRAIGLHPGSAVLKSQEVRGQSCQTQDTETFPGLCRTRNKSNIRKVLC